GAGTIYSYTVVHQAYGAFAGDVPFVVALVELQEGVRMMTRITDSAPETVRIGAPVHVVFEQINDELTLPYFALTEGRA
ncbi:MAG TPA: OB-fold domain-containing protein, partial [Ktedonobacterales bacterium]